MASKEQEKVFGSKGCEQHQFGWVEGSKEGVDPNKEGPQDASGEGYVGCIECGEPAKIILN